MVGSSCVPIGGVELTWVILPIFFWQHLLDAWAIFEEMNVLSMQVL
jgi:hypothetical protein